MDSHSYPRILKSPPAANTRLETVATENSEFATRERHTTSSRTTKHSVDPRQVPVTERLPIAGFGASQQSFRLGGIWPQLD